MKKEVYMSYLHAWGPALVVPAVVLILSFSYRGLMVRF